MNHKKLVTDEEAKRKIIITDEDAKRKIIIKKNIMKLLFLMEMDKDIL
jgi:hypothetical protein